MGEIPSALTTENAARLCRASESMGDLSGSMPMSKDEPLTAHLRWSEHKSLPMTFGQIGRIVGAMLPPSAASVMVVE